MKPKSRVPQRELFGAHLSEMLNPEHPLYVLAECIDWQQFELAIDQCYAEELGRPGVNTRVMVGLMYLKHAFDESDESVVARWVENPYGYEGSAKVHVVQTIPKRATRAVRRMLKRRAAIYAGVAPGIRESGGKTKQLGITKQRSRLLRTILVETAWRLVLKPRRWASVYEKLKARCGAKKAIVAVARRVWCVMVSMLCSGQKYQPT